MYDYERGERGNEKIDLLRYISLNSTWYISKAARLTIQGRKMDNNKMEH